MKELIRNVLNCLDSGYSTREAEEYFHVIRESVSRWCWKRDGGHRIGTPRPIKHPPEAAKLGAVGLFGACAPGGKVLLE